MPRRTDIESILIPGAGPIVIGQACEFDYSGTQACQVLRNEGYRIVLVNSNPATIMTDPSVADATYIEPLDWRVLAEVIERERPDALLPTMGGQTALNTTLDLVREGVLDAFDVELIGANRDAIDKAEDRERFVEAMGNIGLECPRAGIAHSLEEAMQVQGAIGFPCIIRPSFTLGGSGGGVAYNHEEFKTLCQRGLAQSPTTELLIDESLIGWKEFEMEVVRDRRDNCIIVCSIENLDAMGVHTGDSITVAPAQTLTDKEYQRMRNASIDVLREIGVETGGSNVQFAVDPKDGRLVVIEMNPRVSRSSALASKATGFPIAKVAARLAVGYTLDELQNDITGVTPVSFEPAIDYVVVKMPRFTFEKFPAAEDRLTTQMKSVGEAMAMGRTFQEAMQKVLRGLETGISGFDPVEGLDGPDARRLLIRELREPGPHRIRHLADAMRRGMSIEELFEHTGIDPWFLAEIEDVIGTEAQLAEASLEGLALADFRRIKRQGFADARIAVLIGRSESEVRQRRESLGLIPVYKRVDTCAAEFPSQTAYMYSTYETACEANPSSRPKIMVLGGGPNRIGQGIEFDYCCVHAALAMREDGYETIMVNCNPETVSTDYDVSDRLYFEPVTFEDVIAIVNLEQPQGVIVQFGGQTPLKLVNSLAEAGVKILGTSADAIDRAEDRKRFQELIDSLGLRQPPNATVTSVAEGLQAAASIGYPLVVRPSYVLGGRAMELVHSDAELKDYLAHAVVASEESPVLLDKFLAKAVEVDVDAVCDGRDFVIGGIMQHIEQAGIHSGDSSCALPPISLSGSVQEDMRRQTRAMAFELGVVGLMNVQFAVQGDEVYVLEVNPRASRTVPFVSKSIGVSLAKVAARCMVGKGLREQGFIEEVRHSHVSVKEAVFPFNKFPGVDPILSPEMKSTGEVMGIGDSFAEAFAKATLAAGEKLPVSGRAFVSVADSDKEGVVAIAKWLVELGFSLVATRGTAEVIRGAGLDTDVVNKVTEGRPDISDLLKNNPVDLIVNTTEGRTAIADSAVIRRLAVEKRVCYTTTLSGGRAFCEAIAHTQAHTGPPSVRRVQDLSQ